MKKIFLIIITCLITFGAYADFVKYEDAEKVAIAHYHSSINKSSIFELENMRFACVSNPSVRNSDFKFYVFDFQVEDNLGYVIVSSRDDVQPILAYSLENNFDAVNIAPALKMLFDYYESCIEFVSTRTDSPIDEEVSKQWNYLLNYDFSKSRSQAYTSPNLLDDIGIKWNQGSPYNGLCPEDSKAQGGRVPVGCVAIATCQVMKYYNWPPSGEKEHTTNNSKYGKRYVNFAKETYNWNAIPLKSSNIKNEELAKICYHVGVAVDMHWDFDGSGAYTSDVARLLKRYFRYSDDLEFVYKDSYSDEVWSKMLKDEIDAKRPMIYQGLDYSDASAPAGHAWNCDGYEVKEDGTTFFHMNWGWGGSGNNYCTLDKLVSKAIGSGPQYDFVSNQGIVRKIYPKAYADNPYPNFVDGTREIRGQEGSFDDGSSVLSYKPNTESTYILRPISCGSVIDLNFAKFDLADDDELYLYSGEGDDKKILGQFNRENMPKEKSEFRAYDVATIKFVTKDKGGADGWAINYKISNCLNLDGPFTNPTGILRDGSGQDCNYVKGTRCKWLIKPEGAKSIKINIDKFDIDVNDIFQIYKGNTTSSTARVLRIEKGAVPEEYYIIGSDEDPVGEVTISFIAKQTSPGAPGWQISYDGRASIIEEEENEDPDLVAVKFSVFPNPGNNQSKLSISTDVKSEVIVNVFNTMGSTIGSKEFIIDKGINEFRINEITDVNLESGVYFVSINEKNKVTKKERFVIVK